jgi:two-component system chemotaxis response regulator CheB
LDKIIAIGTSTGGAHALEAIFTRLPAITTGIVVVQHMPEVFTAMFAERLNGICAMEIREARHGDRVQAGRVLIAPGGRQMRVKLVGAHYCVSVTDEPPVNRHCPSVDVLFTSIAEVAGSNALGIILTGMGDDGARGIRAMYDAGAMTIAEDESSCVVFGMPAEAIRLGGVVRVRPLGLIPGAIMMF